MNGTLRMSQELTSENPIDDEVALSPLAYLVFRPLGKAGFGRVSLVKTPLLDRKVEVFWRITMVRRIRSEQFMLGGYIL